MEEFIQEFKLESGAIIETLQGLLMSYEESTSKKDVAEELFRGIHTLKGSSKMFGFDAIERVTHQLEDILDECRTNQQKLAPELIDLSGNVLDYCGRVLDQETTKADETRILEMINRFFSQQKSQNNHIQTDLFCVLFRPRPDVFERGINLMAMLNEVQAFGDFASFVHNEETPLEKQIAQKKIVSQFDWWVSTDKGVTSVEDVFLFMKEEEYEILPVTDGTTYNQAIQGIEKMSGKPLAKKDINLRAEFFEKYSQAASVEPSKTEDKDTDDKTSIVAAEESVRPVSDTKLNFINVGLPKLDTLMNLVSELVALSGEVKHQAHTLNLESLGNTAERLERVSTRFRDNAFSMRLVPIQILSIKLQRYVRELAGSMNKKVRFVTEGMDTEIDKAIINQIEAPLMHIIRNAMDHGLETPAERIAKGKPEEGILKISAFYSGTNAFIHIQDDGRGIDLDKVKEKGIAQGWLSRHEEYSTAQIIPLIFKPGVSTASHVSEISGRGVGMDVVKQTIGNLRGSIDVTTEKDLGTSFAIRLPLALSIMDVMLVRVGALHYMFPHQEVELCTSSRFEHIVQKKGPNLRYQDQLMPLINLNTQFESTSSQPGTESSILILNRNDNYLAVEIDEIIGKEQVVIKPVDEALSMINYLSGTAILGNGDLAFLIDVVTLKELYAEAAG